MPRPRCLTCDGVEVVIEWRLVWKELRDGAMVAVGRKVASQEEGLEELVKLGPEALYAEVVSGAKDCPNCKRRPEPVAAKPTSGVAPVKRVEEPREPRAPTWDWKRAQAGDDDE